MLQVGEITAADEGGLRSRDVDFALRYQSRMSALALDLLRASTYLASTTIQHSTKVRHVLFRVTVANGNIYSLPIQ